LENLGLFAGQHECRGLGLTGAFDNLVSKLHSNLLWPEHESYGKPLYRVA